MTNRTWISDNKFEVNALTEGNFLSQIGVEGDVKGWWKAEDFTTAQWEASKGVGDDEYYITQWDDSSGNSNHFVDPWLGGGPQAYGTRSNEHGSGADEVNGYSVVKFENRNSGGNSRDLYLQCLPSNTLDFGIKVNAGDNNPQHIMWVIISKLDGIGTTYGSPIIGNLLKGHNGNTSYSILHNYQCYYRKINAGQPITFKVSHAYGGNAFDACSADDWNITCSCAYGEITTGSYVGQGEYGTTNTNSHIIPNPNSVWCVDCAPNGNSAGNFGTLQSGSASGTVYLTAGISNDEYASGPSGQYPAERNFTGGIAEMACIKSDAPISVYLRARIIEYFKVKFDR